LKKKCSGTGAALTTPFVAYGFPDEETAKVWMFHGDEQTRDILSFAGFISVGVLDKYTNPISNKTVEFVDTDVSSDCVSDDETRLSALLVPVDDPCMQGVPSYGTCSGSPRAGKSLEDISSHLGAAVQVFTGAAPGASYPIKATCADAPVNKTVTFHLYTYPFGNCSGDSPPSSKFNMTAVYRADKNGENITAGKVGATIPLRARIYFLREGETEKTVTIECEGNVGECTKIVGSKVYSEDTVFQEASVTFGDAPGKEDPAGNGIYSAQYTLKAGLNTVTITGSATAALNKHKTITDCDGPEMICNTVVEEVTGEATATMEVYGVDIQVPDKLLILADEKGYTKEDYIITYTIVPAEYQAATAYVVILKDGEPFWYIPSETQGEGTATLSRGFWFDPESDYEAQVVLNQGSGVEITSTTIPIEFKALWLEVDHESTEQSKRIRVKYYLKVDDPSVIQKIEFIVKNPNEVDENGEPVVVYSTDSEINPNLTKIKDEPNVFDWDGMDNNAELTFPWDYTLEMNIVTLDGQTQPIPDTFDRTVIPIARIDNSAVFSRHNQDYTTTYTVEADSNDENKRRFGSFKFEDESGDVYYYFPGPLDGFYARIKGEDHDIYITGNEETDYEAFLHYDLRDYDAKQVKSTGAQLVQRMLNLALGVKGELEGLAKYDQFGSTNPLYTPLKIDSWFGDDTAKALQEFKKTYMTGESDLINEESILRKYSNLPPEHDVETVSSVYYQYITGADTMKALMKESKKYDNMVTYNKSDPNDTDTLYGLLTNYAKNNKPDDLTDEEFIAFAKGVALQESKFYHATAQGFINSPAPERVTSAKGIYQIILSTWKGIIIDDDSTTPEQRYIEEYNVKGGITYLTNQYNAMKNAYSFTDGWNLSKLQRMKMAAAAYSRGKGNIDSYFNYFKDIFNEPKVDANIFETQYHKNIEELLTAIIAREQERLTQTTNEDLKKEIQERITFIKEGRDYVNAIFINIFNKDRPDELGWYGYFKANPSKAFEDNNFIQLPYNN